ncbi:hypothetical protein BU24DRAFT_495485 [Aaosphaeria arxii CBS 175.79]|uniref:Uncharacterized protein n=1 Tax=Aaosphaeria arxii CBS 175.79 TaxID=1450172 RepID=A0A6A5XE23_9PLEO|nr:uncharacterized protein BU24DRAFT_495485 [Aaosphaeria arxii CBS 175.79]KAF2011268.1 hypothetical protein BU24DRAFT_495485 [Aaosphaeria arxii CBS 175.79]
MKRAAFPIFLLSTGVICHGLLHDDGGLASSDVQVNELVARELLDAGNGLLGDIYPRQLPNPPAPAPAPLQQPPAPDTLDTSPEVGEEEDDAPPEPDPNTPPEPPPGVPAVPNPNILPAPVPIPPVPVPAPAPGAPGAPPLVAPKPAVPGGVAPAPAPAPTIRTDEYSTTVQWVESHIGTTATTWYPQTVVMLFKATPGQGAAPGSGAIGMGTLTGEVGRTKTVVAGSAATAEVKVWGKAVGVLAGVGLGVVGLL